MAKKKTTATASTAPAAAVTSEQAPVPSAEELAKVQAAEAEQAAALANAEASQESKNGDAESDASVDGNAEDQESNGNGGDPESGEENQEAGSDDESSDPEKEKETLNLGAPPAEVTTPAAPATAPKTATAAVPTTPKSREYMELTKMLDMYRDMCKERTLDRTKLQARMKVLFSIVRLVSPNSTVTSNRYNTRELVELLYERMTAGSGTIFTDAYIFKLTYALPASDAVKFEAFYTAFLQLVNARLRGARITFNMDVLRDVLKNEGVMEAIRIIRSRFE